MSDFVHLRVQSSYSLLSSALKLGEITECCAKYQMPAVALTDRNNLFSSLEFAILASKNSLQSISGAILTLKLEDSGKESFSDILLLAKNEQGYRNLLHLATIPYTQNNRDIQEHISIDDLRKYSDGLIMLSGYNLGPIGIALLDDDVVLATSRTKLFQEIFGNRFYFEIMRHDLKDEKLIEAAYLQLANKLQVPLVATNNVLFKDIEMHDAHDVLLCIADGVVSAEPNRTTVSNQCYFKSSVAMKQLFTDLPSAIENSANIARRCSFIPEEAEPSLPRFSPEGVSEDDFIRKEAKQGLQDRLQHKFALENITDQEAIKKLDKEYNERLDYELDIICTMGFPGYFLIVSDFIRWSKENGISVGPGRGSGAGSVVAWSLQITDLDPIGFGLLFERFLNPERVSMPDFDIDFCQERREEVIRYVRGKYGDDRVGQIITFGKMQAKAVIKDVSRVLGLRYEFADYLTELVPFNAVHPVTLAQAIEQVSELKQAYQGKGVYNLQGEEALIKQVLDTALVLEGLHRHVSVHAAGVIIAKEPLLNTVPLYQDRNSDFHTVQYSMKYAEAAGLLKFDFLGLQTLTVISKCRELLRKRDIEIDPLNLPLKDLKTFKMMGDGRSHGVFQFESVGMRDALRKMGPDCLDDLIALGALYRPGPMENIPTYIACKHGKQTVDYLHPMLEEVLRETYGVIIYQEQVMEIAQRLAGYTLGAADLLRRAMGKKIKAEMEAQEELFVKGSIANNVSEEQARSIFALVNKFAGYGFNKSHAAAYGMISYQTAYLKANYPVEFITACLNLDINDNDKVHLFINDAKQFGIEVITPDINRSSGSFIIEDGKIIFALGAIRNVSKAVGEIVHETAQTNGPFKSIIDFVEKMPEKSFNKRALENFIKSGCFDKLHSSRNTLLASIPALMSHAALHHQEKSSQQFALMAPTTTNLLGKEVETIFSEKAFYEFESAGLFLQHHPLEEFSQVLEHQGIITCKQLFSKKVVSYGASKIKLTGILQKKDSRMSAKGRFITLHLSDHTGSFEVTIFNEQILRDYAHLLLVKNHVVLECDAFKDKGGIRLTASRVLDGNEELAGGNHNIKLQCRDKGDLEKVTSLLQKRRVAEDGSKVVLNFVFQGNLAAIVDFKEQFEITPADLKALKDYIIK